MKSIVPVSVAIPAFKRIDILLETLGKIADCSPQPTEIMVHVDGGQQATADAVRAAFPEVTVLLSAENIGPGGGRDRLLRDASQPLVVSFDDDSYPQNNDFFARVVDIFEQFPAAAILFADITERNKQAPRFSAGAAWWVADFVGCGCAYRRDVYLPLAGYLSLPNAYGCEEVDLALQLAETGKRILYHPELRVFHDTEMVHHSSAAINAASVRNLALLAFLRYPVYYWPLGVLQVVSRVRYLVGMKRFRGLVAGVAGAVPHCARYRAFRKPVSAAAFRRYRTLRLNPEEVTNE